MKKILCLFLSIICFSCIIYSQNTGRTVAGKIKVAIYVTGDEVSQGYKKIIGSKLVSGITNSEEYAAVERTNEFLGALSKEIDYANSGVVTDSQIAQLGKQFGVKYVLVADISEILESIFVSVRMINVETGLITASADADKQVNSIEDLTTLSEELIARIFDGTISTSSNKLNGHEAIDLGLSVKWASCNVGATTPEGYGDYFAWGETQQKPTYTTYNSVTYGKTVAEISGDATYDAARAKWGGSWRLPTWQEVDELLNRCTWVWMTQNGRNGYRVTGPNGNSIFLPAAGYRYESSLSYAGSRGRYWCSTPDDSDAKYSYVLYFNSSSHDRDSNNRYNGRSVRPVSE